MALSMVSFGKNEFDEDDELCAAMDVELEALDPSAQQTAGNGKGAGAGKGRGRGRGRGGGYASLPEVPENAEGLSWQHYIKDHEDITNPAHQRLAKDRWRKANKKEIHKARRGKNPA